MPWESQKKEERKEQKAYLRNDLQLPKSEERNGHSSLLT